MPANRRGSPALVSCVGEQVLPGLFEVGGDEDDRGDHGSPHGHTERPWWPERMGPGELHGYADSGQDE